MVHSGYHPLKHCPLRIVLMGSVWMVQSGYHPLKASFSISSSSALSSWDSARMVHSGYHPLRPQCPLRIVLGWSTVDIILLSIVLLGWC